MGPITGTSAGCSAIRSSGHAAAETRHPQRVVRGKRGRHTMTDVAHDADLQRLYDDFDSAHLIPLWTQIDDLMPEHPEPAAQPYHWAWSALLPPAERAGDRWQWGGAGSGGPSPWPIPGWRAARSRPPPCGRPSSTW